MSINYSQSVSFPYLVRNILYGSQKTLSVFSSRIECFSLHLHACMLSCTNHFTVEMKKKPQFILYPVSLF